LDRSKIGVVIPAYNEELSIAKVIEGINPLGIAIVVNDGSTDLGPEIAKNSGAVIVNHKVNCGYDCALDSGFKKAAELNCDFVITIDADGQHDPTVLYEFIEAYEKGADLVLGIRDRKQRFSEHVFAWVTNLLYGIKDPLCGMKGYRIEIYRQLGHFDSYGSIGTELALFGVRSKYQFVQVNVPTREREGASRFGRFIYANYVILKAMFKSFFLIHPTNDDG
jgi:glycosyltransferase involved in cell wall biosynthesis